MSEDRGGPRVVVAAAVLDGPRLLAARRSTPPHLAGGWELPGGKVDPGETDHEALHRELHEELGVRVRLGARVGGDWPMGSSPPGAVLRVWTATVTEGVARPLEDHSELRWLLRDDWDTVAWLPADLPVVAALSLLGDLDAAGALTDSSRDAESERRSVTDE